MDIYEKLEELDNRIEAINEHRPLTTFEVREAKNFFRASHIWSTNNIEGNTITLDETRAILEDGVTIGGHTLQELYQITGTNEAYEYMYGLINSDGLTEQNIKELHYLFAQNMPELQPGQYRDLDVIITGAEHIPPEHGYVPYLMEKFIENYQKTRNALHPVLVAADFHIELVKIHPFRDGNGRVSRLSANAILLQNHYLPIEVPPIRKREYCRALDIAHCTGNKDPFRNFFVEMAEMVLVDYMRMLHVPFSGKEKKQSGLSH